MKLLETFLPQKARFKYFTGPGSGANSKQMFRSVGGPTGRIHPPSLLGSDPFRVKNNRSGGNCREKHAGTLPRAW